MIINNVDNSGCFSDFFTKYQANLEQDYDFLCELEIKVFERSSEKLAIYRNDPMIDQSYFDSPFMCNTLEVENNKAEIYLVTDYCDKIKSQESRYALILHEFGHIISKKQQSNMSEFEEEAFADRIASQIIGSQRMINALSDMAEDHRFIRLKEEMKKRIDILKL